MYLPNLTNRLLGQHWQTPPSATPPLTKLAWLCFRASSVFLSPSRPPLVPTHHWVRSSDPQGQRPILSFQDRPWPAFFEEPIFQHLRGLDIPIIFVFVCWVVFTIIRWIISTPVLHTLLLFWHIWAKDEQNKTRTFGDVGNWSRDDCQTCLCSQIKNFPQLPWHLWHFIYIYIRIYPSHFPTLSGWVWLATPFSAKVHQLVSIYQIPLWWCGNPLVQTWAPFRNTWEDKLPFLLGHFPFHMI